MGVTSTSVSTRLREIIDTFSAADADPAWLLCDRHPSEDLAFTIVERDGAVTEVSFGELRARSEQLAGALHSLGVRQGDRVATLMGKGSDLVSVLLGIWRIGAAYVPLFTAFAADAVGSRLTGAEVKVVLADAANVAKLPAGDWIAVLAGEDAPLPEGARRLADIVAAATPFTGSTPLGGGGDFVHMFTSGTTGSPKGVVHPLRYVAGWQSYLEFTLGLQPDSVYWCGADPGWAYGLYSAVVAPMALGVRSVLQCGGFDPAVTWATMATLGVTDYTAAPTVYRALRASGIAAPDGLRLQRLSSAGEPLTAEVNEWARPTLGLEVHDHYGQTEVGMVAGFPHHPEVAVPVAPQTMGVALPGWSTTVLREATTTPAGVGEPGVLAIDVAHSPLMIFTSYHGRAADDRFTKDGAFYLTGDLVARNADDTLRFSSRDDDVIIMAGYRIGPFEIETVLAQHPAVAECAVVAAPDRDRGEVVEAFVVLRAGVSASSDIQRELQQHVRERYAAHAYPRRVHLVAELPKTPSGKIQRAQLRRELRETAQQ